MLENELTVADLATKSAPKAGATGKKVTPEYREPVSGAMWAERGLKLKWLQAALEAGKSVADFAI